MYWGGRGGGAGVLTIGQYVDSGCCVYWGYLPPYYMLTVASLQGMLCVSRRVLTIGQYIDVGFVTGTFSNNVLTGARTQARVRDFLVTVTLHTYRQTQNH